MAAEIVRSATHCLRKVSAASPLKLQQTQLLLWLRKLCVLRGWLFVSCRTRRSPLTTLKHNHARTHYSCSQGHFNFRWIFNKEGFATNLKTLSPDAQFPQPQRHYEVAHSPRRAKLCMPKTHSTLFLDTQLKCRCG